MKAVFVFLALAIDISEAIDCYNGCATGSVKFNGEEKTLTEMAEMGIDMGESVCSANNITTCDGGVTECMTVMIEMKMKIGDQSWETKMNSNTCSVLGSISDDMKAAGCNEAEKALEGVADSFKCEVKTCTDGPSCGGTFVSFSLALLLAAVAQYLF